MKKKLVYICSPCRGITANIQLARIYCAKVMREHPDVIPIAPHVYFTQFLDDAVPTERSLGMEAGLALLEMCDELWVYGIGQESEGMTAEIKRAQELGIPVKDGNKTWRGSE